MTGAERGFLLLTSHLGEPGRKPLTTAQLRTLADRIAYAGRSAEERDLAPEDLTALGYSNSMAARMISLLSQEDVLDYYLRKGQILGCTGYQSQRRLSRSLAEAAGIGQSRCSVGQGRCESSVAAHDIPGG